MWPGERGFVGGTVDASTGLTHLGAREYDPGLGRFVSVDPVMDVADSQQMHGYSYSNNNPATFSDPDGLHYICGGPAASCAFEGEAWTSNPDKAQQYNDQREAKYGTNPGKASHDTYMNSSILGQSLNEKALASLRYLEYKGSPKFTRLEALEFALVSERAWGAVCQVLEGGAADRCLPDLWGDGLVKLAEFVYELTPIPDAVECVGGSAEGCAWLAANVVPGAKLLKGIDNAADMARTGKRACAPNSFVPGTEVLMADGSRKPIEDVEVGDEVLATDPVTGETGARKVVATIVGQGRKNLVELTIDTDGPTSNRTGTIVTTANHPFWVDDQGRWIDADDMRSGDDLRAASNVQATVVSALSHAGYEEVYNLTVDDIHTYYVFANQAAILVHNSGGKCGREALDESFKSASTPAKLEHVIDPDKHGFSGLVSRAGGREQAMRRIVDSLGDAADLPQSGRFEVARSIDGESVTIRGAVVDGIPRIGTAFIRGSFPG